MSVALLLAICLLLHRAYCQIYRGSIENIIDGNSISITIDYGANTVDLVLTGTSNLWNGWGIGNTVMSGTYAIIAEYSANDPSQGVVNEYVLGAHASGQQYPSPEIQVLSDSDDGNQRVIAIRRSIDGQYTFPSSTATSFTLSVISAIGPIASGYATDRNARHSSSSRAPAQITLSQVTDEEVVLCLAFCAGQNVDCTQSSSSCLVECSSLAACAASIITCNVDNDCVVEANEMESLRAASIYAPTGYSLDIQCWTQDSCQLLQIFASDASNVHLYCLGVNACENVEIHCPQTPHTQSTPSCQISGNSIDWTTDIQLNMKIYAQNGWSDVQIINYTPTVSGTANQLFCGPDLTDSCTIVVADASWTCLETDSLCSAPQSATPTTTGSTLSTSSAPTTFAPTLSIPSSSSTVNPILPTTASASCANGELLSSSASSSNGIQITATINCVEQSITMDIYYADFHDNWFGLVFSSSMFGDSLVYTTGKNADRPAALYSYDIQGQASFLVTYNADKDWTEIDTQQQNGIRVLYQTPLSNTQWTAETDHIQLRAAVGRAMNLAYHASKSESVTMTLSEVVPTAPTTASPTTAAPTTSIPTISPSLASTTATSTTPPPTSTSTSTSSSTSTVSPTPSPTTSTTTTTPAPVASEPTVSPTSRCGGILSATQTSDNGITVTLSIDCVQQTAVIEMDYPNYNNNWFGVVFGSRMFGDGLVFTTGKTESRPEQLYAYDIQGQASFLVTYDATRDWTEVETQYETGIHIIYQTALSNTPWNADTESIQLRAAIGKQLKLAYHASRSATLTLNLAVVVPTTRTTPAPVTISPTSTSTSTPSPSPTTAAPSTPFPTSTPPTRSVRPSTVTPVSPSVSLTVSPSAAPPSVQCPNGDTLSGSVSTPDLTVSATLNCLQQSITMSIEYNQFRDNWFGLVFNDYMRGRALIYTTGKFEMQTQALHSYTLNGYSSFYVIYRSDLEWTQIENVQNARSVRVVSTQHLANTDWNAATTQIIFRYAIGSTLKLEKHVLTSDTYTLMLTEDTSVSTTSTPTSSASTTALTNAPSRDTRDPTTSTSTTTRTPTATRVPTQSPTDSPSATDATTTVPHLDCPYGQILRGSANTEDLRIDIMFFCMDEVIELEVIYGAFDSNWFGIVFDNDMIGDSICFTTHKTGDMPMVPGLYAYDLFGYGATNVVRNPSKDWTEMDTVIDTHGIRLRYTQELSATAWTKNMNEIILRYAIGNALELQKHTFVSNPVSITLSNFTASQTTESPSTTEFDPRSVIICDEFSNCNATTVACNMTHTLQNNGSCIIECVAANACNRARFECLDGFDCILECAADGACKDAIIQCGNDANCEIRGNGVSSLQNMTISGQVQGGSLTVECNAANSCSSALIAGAHSVELEVICGEAQSCSELIMQCPTRCKITSSSDASVGDVIHILAANSWDDLDDSSYLPLGTEIDMHCGAMYDWQCDLPLNHVQLLDASNWNCRNKASLCWTDRTAVNIIRCNAETPCLHTNISCDIANDTDGGCRVICDGHASCSHSGISCDAEGAFCDIICNGADSCSDINSVQCGQNSQCNIDCFGEHACSNLDVHCPSSADGDCHINAFDVESLRDAHIDCASSNCSIHCESGNSCQEAIIYGQAASLVEIECVNASCTNLELHCPPSISLEDRINPKRRCILSGGEGDEHSEVIIYAQNSWIDVDLSEYSGIIEYDEEHANYSNYTNTSSLSRMYCGSDFVDSCVISNEWNCIDDSSSCYIGDTPMICEHEAQCAGQALDCSDRVVVDECTLQCKAAGACSDITFHCKDDKSCRVVCESADSCRGAVIHCGNNDNCFVTASAKNALFGAHIIGGVASTDVSPLACALNVACTASSACMEARVFGQHVDELNIDCQASDACKDIAIHCPAHSLHEVTGEMVAHCVVNGGEENRSETVHQNLSIHAEHSWIDIEFRNYLPLIFDSDSKMFCGEAGAVSECYINNPFADGEWNCISEQSKCFVASEVDKYETEAPSLTVVICDDGENNCEHETDLYCSNSFGCRFLCSSNSSCRHMNIHCGDTERCHVVCNGSESCAESVVFGGLHTSVEISCDGELSCSSARFAAADASELSVHCVGRHGCKNLNMSCPPHETTEASQEEEEQFYPVCVLQGGSDDVHEELTFYAVNGFEDLDVSRYEALLVNLGTEDNMNRMHCGDEYEYECVIHYASDIDNTLFCDCGYEYEYDSREVEDDEGELSEQALVAIILPICFVFVVVVVVLIICIFWYPRSKHMHTSPTEAGSSSHGKRKAGSAQYTPVNAAKGGKGKGHLVNDDEFEDADFDAETDPDDDEHNHQANNAEMTSLNAVL